MNQSPDIEESSIVEYSLSELGFVLVFVLLLLSGWEVNGYNRDKRIALNDVVQLEDALESSNEQISLLKDVLKKVNVDEEWDDELILVSKSDWLTQQEKIEAIEEAVEDDFLTEVADQLNPSDTEEIELLAGAPGFCTYRLPEPNSDKLYGKSVPLGKMVIGEDYLMLISKNESIVGADLVDMAGLPYDISLALQELNVWPINKKLSRAEFLDRGRRFVEIGDMPSPQRVECRFGMDYYKASYSQKADNNFVRVFQNVFYRHAEISESDYQIIMKPVLGAKASKVALNIGALDKGLSFPRVRKSVTPDYPD